MPRSSRRTRSSTSSRRKLTTRDSAASARPNNPGVTTYIDGVPQLNANSSSQELLGIDQIDFVRGPLSALYGRNASAA
jgi:outer membrane receptor protein involved in Fe transport